SLPSTSHSPFGPASVAAVLQLPRCLLVSEGLAAGVALGATRFDIELVVELHDPVKERVRSGQGALAIAFGRRVAGVLLAALDCGLEPFELGAGQRAAGGGGLPCNSVSAAPVGVGAHGFTRRSSMNLAKSLSLTR